MGQVLRADGSTVIARCAITESPHEKAVGLLPRASLAEDEAMWFPRSTSVHTFFMRFPIDVAFLDRRRRVIALYPALRPWRHTWIHPWAFGGGILELSAGALDRAGVKKGEELRICVSS